jgi:hypothetical protein
MGRLAIIGLASGRKDMNDTFQSIYQGFSSFEFRRRVFES